MTKCAFFSLSLDHALSFSLSFLKNRFLWNGLCHYRDERTLNHIQSWWVFIKYCLYLSAQCAHTLSQWMDESSWKSNVICSIIMMIYHQKSSIWLSLLSRIKIHNVKSQMNRKNAISSSIKGELYRSKTPYAEWEKQISYDRTSLWALS